MLCSSCFTFFPRADCHQTQKKGVLLLRGGKDAFVPIGRGFKPGPYVCADIVAGRPVGDTRLADASKDKASTDTDANQCVTSAELRLNDTFKGNTAAYVVNGCGQPVDVRVCLMTESGGWNCGSTAGLQPQGRWSFSSFNATGQVFVDAHTSGSGKPFASPN